MSSAFATCDDATLDKLVVQIGQALEPRRGGEEKGGWRPKAKTTEYAHTRRVHPKIERKLNELARHHGCRRACYRGKPTVLTQSLLTASVVNIKRIVNLLARSIPWPMPTVTVRAEVVGS